MNGGSLSLSVSSSCFVANNTGKTIQKVLHFGLTSFLHFYSVEWCFKTGKSVASYRQLALSTCHRCQKRSGVSGFSGGLSGNRRAFVERKSRRSLSA